MAAAGNRVSGERSPPWIQTLGNGQEDDGGELRAPEGGRESQCGWRWSERLEQTQGHVGASGGAASRWSVYTCGALGSGFHWSKRVLTDGSLDRNF